MRGYEKYESQLKGEKNQRQREVERNAKITPKKRKKKKIKKNTIRKKRKKKL